MVVALIATTLGWAPRPAAAALTSANPADGYGELYPDLTTKDALFAYVTSDTRGGRVCVVAATGTPSCERPAWGTPNILLGIGTMFTLIEGPDLEVGTWRLHTENPAPDDVWTPGYTSDVFTVRPCDQDCDSTIGRQQADEFKAASVDNTKLARASCTAFAVMDRAVGPRLKITNRNPGARSASGLRIVASLPSGGGLALTVGLELGSAAAGVELAQRMACQVAKMHEDIANDPPDPALHEVAEPQLLTLPVTGSEAMDELATALDRQAALGIAARISYERYQGAVLAGDLAAQRIQARAIGDHAGALAQELRDSADALRTAADAAAGDPDLDGVVATAEEQAAFVEVSQRVRASGLTADEEQQLLEQGVDAADLPAVESWFDLPFEELVPGQTLPDVMLELADGFEASVEAVDAFARNASAIAHTDLAAPSTAITVLDVSGATWRFRAEATSPDGDPLEHEWRFGDGTVATGSEVEHTYTSSGAFTVRLTTRETTAWGSSATAEHPVTVQLNRPPWAAPDELGVALGATESVDVLADDSDPDGDPLEVVSVSDAAGGTVSCEPTGLCSYTADAGVVGVETLVYEVSDGEATTSSTIEVTIVPSAAPVAQDLAVSIPAGSTATVRLPVSDPEPGPNAALEPEVVDEPSTVAAVPWYPESFRITVPPGAAPGTDTFTYRVSDGAQRSATATITVTIPATNEPPTAQAMAVSTPAGVPLPITLLGSDPEGTPLQYYLYPATGGRVSGTGPDVVYDPESVAPGTYTFQYAVSDGARTSARATVTVTVGPPPGGPIVDLGPDRSLHEGYVLFSATARDTDGGPVTLAWDFGDGRTSTARNPYLVFDDGTYDVRLTVTDQEGRSASDTAVLTVHNVAPYVAGISMSVPPRAVGHPVTLSASASDAGGDALTFRWSFGDGTTAESDETSIEHTYDTPGTMRVHLAVVDEDGATTSQLVDVEIIEPWADAGPDQHVPEGSYVDFSGTAFVADAGASHQWSFGDGSDIAYGSTVRHRWVGDEPRTATLDIVWNDLRATDTAQVTFSNLPPALGPAVPLVVEAGTSVHLLAGAHDPGGDDLSIDWDLGDGSTASGPVVQKAYAAPGDYLIEITAEDDEGASTSTTARITVVAPGALGPPTVDSRGRDFHLAFDRNNTKAGAEQYLMITGEQDTTGTVSVPGLGFRTDFAIAAGRISIVRLPDDVVPDDISLATTGTPTVPPAVTSDAVVVHARREVTVYGVNREQYTTDAFLAVPDDIAGTATRAMSWGPLFGQIDVVGLVEGTHVTVEGAPGEPAHEAELGAGEVLRVNNTGTYAELAGRSVVADRPVQVLSGHQCAAVQRRYCDHLAEAIWPTAMWGRQFLTVPLAGRNGDTFRVVADRDGTEVRIDGELVATLEAGGFHEQLLTEAAEITTSEPSLVAQFANGSEFDGLVGDPFQMLVPPQEQWLDRYTVATVAGISRNHLNVVIRADAAGSLQLDGALVAPSAWTPIGTSGYVGARLDVTGGEHRLVADRPFALLAYGFDTDDSYGYPGGLALAPVAAVATVSLDPSAGQREVGTEDCPVATVADAAGNGLAGVRVDLEVTGANPAAMSAFTGADGTAPLCRTGLVAGVDELVVTSGPFAAQATRQWVEGTPETGRPTAADVAATTDEDTPVDVTLDGTDPDGDPLTYRVVDQPANGSLGAVVGDQVTYTPDADFTGTDTFTYAVDDGTGESAPATVTVDVTAVDDPPAVRAGDDGTGREGAPVDLAGVVTDADGDPLSISWSFVAGADVDAGASCTFTSPDAPSTSVTCTDDGTYELTLAASDGTSRVSDSLALVLSNAAPAVTISSPSDLSIVGAGSVVDLVAPVTDPGTNDGLGCRVDWGDGTIAAGTVVGGTCEASHTYAVESVPGIEVTVEDDDGAQGSDELVLVVAAGGALVTGGGWLLDDDGARVRTGFVARQESGGPSGQLQLRTPDGGRFHGDTVEELTASGSTVTWRGSGRLDGADGHRYELTVVDGGVGRGRRAGTDRFTVVVRDAGGEIVLEVDGPLAGGQIVVHREGGGRPTR